MSVQVLELKEKINTLSGALQVLKLQPTPPVDLIESSRKILKQGKAALVLNTTAAFPTISAELNKARLACEDYLSKQE